jgi:putative ABC transport system permease protein
MNFRDIIGLALRNLRQAKLRTALTTLGVSIGIASLSGMVSLGVGLQDQLVGRVLQSGLFDSITVVSPSLLGAAGAAMAARGRGGLSAGTASAPAARLDDAALQQFSAMENVREVYPNIRVPVQLALGEFSRLTAISGVPMSAKSEGTFQTISYGAFFANDSEPACMLGLNMAKEISAQDPGGLIGKTATFSYAAVQPAKEEGDPANPVQMVRRVELQCRIAGIVERDQAGIQIGIGVGAGASPVMIPLKLAQTIDAEVITDLQPIVRNPSAKKTYASVTVKVKQAKSTQDVEDRIRRMGYTVFSISDALRGAKTAFIVFDIILSLIGSIALAVSSLGIVNTMVMSILERTREIGIMKAIGASDEQIRRIFLIEASVIGILGGIAGIVIGWIVGRGINLGANFYIQTQGGTPGTFFSLPLWLIAGAIAFSILVSLMAGSYPASRAARLDPIRALRHD